MPLLRVRMAEWEAQRDGHHGAESVYTMEHVEGSHRIIIRRPHAIDTGYYPPLEFVRAGTAPMPPPSGPLAHHFPPSPHGAGPPGYGGPCMHSRDRGYDRGYGGMPDDEFER